MSSSIRLTNSGAPDTPPIGYARIFVGEYQGRLHLKMVRPDGTIEIFGTIDIPLPVDRGGTGIVDTPGIGQFLIGTGTGYRIGEISAGPGINISSTETSFEISSDISNIELVMPSEFDVTEETSAAGNQFIVTKVNQAPNTVYAGPNSVTENQPSFRSLVQNDIPQLSTTKIIDFVDEVQGHIADSLDNSGNITLVYNSETNKFKADLVSTGVVAGVYGTSLNIPAVEVDSNGRVVSISTNVATLTSENITDFVEKVEDTVGLLTKDTDSIDVAYNDVLSTLELHVKPEYLITTNISQTENFKAPTSQAIKLYVDEAISSESEARNEQITAVYNAITAHREVIPLTSAMLAEQIELQEAVSLTHIMPNSVVAFIDRIGLFEDLDFALADGPNDKVVLTLNPSALAIMDGSEVLRISYLTKI